MTLHDAFLRDILISPHDDAVRLIYADWLEEQGDPASAARSAFIRVQIRLAGMAGTEPHFEETRQRELSLLRAHEREWLGPVRSALQACVFRRGFVEEVTVSAAHFLAHVEGLLNREPVCRVRFLRAAAHIGALADCPLLARPYALEFSYCYLNDGAVQLLVASPYLAGLEELVLDHNFIRSAGGEALARAPQLFNLSLLDLRGNHLGSVAREILRDRFGAAVRF
jgi:uncharacterized protein (TIGR02996 family)